MENRNGLAVDGRLTLATGTAEREAALDMIEGICGSRRITLGADKGYDTADFVAELRARGVTPHVAQNTTNRRSAIDDRTTRHEGYDISQRKRKRVEESSDGRRLSAESAKSKFADWIMSAPSSPLRSQRLTSCACASSFQYPHEEGISVS